jgi:hypothetical protein
MAVHNRAQASLAIKGGVVAGLVGGIVLSCFMLAVSLTNGVNGWVALKAPGAPLLGERALHPGFDITAVAVGVLSHFATSIVWGVLFGLLFFGLTRLGTLLAGATWSVVVWIAMRYAVLPALGLAELGGGMPMELEVFSHLLFGVSAAAAFLPFQRALPRIGLRPPYWRPSSY